MIFFYICSGCVSPIDLSNLHNALGRLQTCVGNLEPAEETKLSRSRHMVIVFVAFLKTRHIDVREEATILVIVLQSSSCTMAS